MAREKLPEPEDLGGAPEWMVTFSDCMTLLLTFFVLLLSFSSFNKGAFDQLADTMGSALPSASKKNAADRSSLIKQVKKKVSIRDKGSNTPTHFEQLTNNTMRETDPKNFRTLRVFSIPSKQVFLGSGKALSPDGKKTLETMAQFLQKMPSRVVISETGPSGNHKTPFFGYQRAWQVMNYLNKHGVPTETLNITKANTLHQNTAMRIKDRQLQITLLERNTYEP